MDYNRKFKCKFCDYRGNREQLVGHIENKHSEYVNDEYPASRIVYNYLNNVETGKCIICGKPTKWNDKTWKYYRHCGSTACKEKIKDTYRKNAIAATGKYNFTTDPKHLEKMLAARHISGVYTFSNGAKKTYTGSYERKAIEFLDKVMNVDPDDVLMPGPIFEYDYNGEKHKWITDIYYIPYNLVIEVKDGGDNPNKREMPEYRAKQLAKEKAIIQLGTYNYLRLTNNDFSQLFKIFAALRIAMINDTEETRKSIIQINEETMLETTCASKPDLALLFVYNELCNRVERIGLTDMSSQYCTIPEGGILQEIDKADLSNNTMTYLIKEPSQINIQEIANIFKNKTPVNKYTLFEMVCGKQFVSLSQLVLENNLVELELENHTFSELTRNALDISLKNKYCIESTYTSNLKDEIINKMNDYGIKLNSSIDGYYLESTGLEPALATIPNPSLYFTISQLNSFALLIKKYGGNQ